MDKQQILALKERNLEVTKRQKMTIYENFKNKIRANSRVYSNAVPTVIAASQYQKQKKNIIRKCDSNRSCIIQ